MKLRTGVFACLILAIVATVAEHHKSSRKERRGEIWMIQSNFNDQHVKKDGQKLGAVNAYGRSGIQPKRAASVGNYTAERTSKKSKEVAGSKRNFNVANPYDGRSGPAIRKTLNNRGSSAYLIHVDDRTPSPHTTIQNAEKKMKIQNADVKKPAPRQYARNQVLNRTVLRSGLNATGDVKRTRQEIEHSPDVYVGESVGKPYGDPDTYQTIGDGIYLMSTEQEKALAPGTTYTSMQNTDAYFNTNIKDLGLPKEADETVNAGTAKDTAEPSATNLKQILTKLDKNTSDDSGGGAKLQDAGQELPADIEAVTPNEQQVLEKFENTLKTEDRVISKTMLKKDVDKSQEDYVIKTNEMLRNDSKQVLHNVVDKMKAEDSTFVQTNPYVADKPEILKALNNINYDDVSASKRGSLPIDNKHLNKGSLQSFNGRSNFSVAVNSSGEGIHASKRGFLPVNDNLNVQQVYDSLLKEDEMLIKGMSPKSDINSAMGRETTDPDDARVKEFLKFAEKQDDEIENDAKKKASTNKKKGTLNKKKVKYLVLEPSVKLLSSSYDSNGRSGASNVGKKESSSSEDRLGHTKSAVLNMKEFGPGQGNSWPGEANEADERSKQNTNTKTDENKKQDKYTEGRGGDKKRDKHHRDKLNSQGDSDRGNSVSYQKLMSTRPHMDAGEMPTVTTTDSKGDQSSFERQASGKMHSLANEGTRLHQRRQGRLNRISIYEMPNANNNKHDAGFERKASYNSVSKHRKSRTKKQQRSKSKTKTQKHEKLIMEDGELANELFSSSRRATQGTKKVSREKKDKEYYWHGTAKPETRQLPTDVSEEMKKFRLISNMLPMTLRREGVDVDGESQLIGNTNNIATFEQDPAIKEADETDDNGQKVANPELTEYDYDTPVMKPSKKVVPLNKINEDEISSTSFFSASRSSGSHSNNVEKTELDPPSGKTMSEALSQISSKEIQDAKGLANEDSSKMLAFFDQNSLQPRLEEFTDEASQIKPAKTGNRHEKESDTKGKKKVKILLHIPDLKDDEIQDIHDKDSDVSLGTIKDMTSDLDKKDEKPRLGEDLADDDEDTLEEILSKPTAKLVQFHQPSTQSANDYVPENVIGQESNKWDERDTDKKEINTFNDNEKHGEKQQNDLLDAMSASKILSLIKANKKYLKNRDNKQEENEHSKSEKSKDDVNDAQITRSKAKHRKLSNKSQHKSSTGVSAKKALNTKRKDYSSVSQRISELLGIPGNNEDLSKLDHEAMNSMYQPPDIYQDHMDYGQQSKQISQFLPTEAVNQIKAIFDADANLRPLTFLESGPVRIGADGGEKTQIQQLLIRPKIEPKSTAKKKVEGENAPSTRGNTVASAAPNLDLLPPSRKLRIQGGQILGGKITGGLITGGRVDGGDIEGGAISGGRVEGGLFLRGKMENGVLYNGTVEGGTIKGGEIYGGEMLSGLMEGGKLKGGKVSGGILKGGEVDGGALKSGEILGGFLKNGSVEGGILKGGTIEGGHLLGGVMLGGHLRGGVVKSGIIKGGTIEGGVVEGGVIEDGVVIRGGNVRGNSYDAKSGIELNGNKNGIRNAEMKNNKEIQSPEIIQILSDKQAVNNAMTKLFTADVDAQDHTIEPSSHNEPLGDASPSKSNEDKAPNQISILGAPESWPVESKDTEKNTDNSKANVAPVTYASSDQTPPKPVPVKQGPMKVEKKISPAKIREFLYNMDRTKESAAVEKKEDRIKETKTNEVLGASPASNEQSSEDNVSAVKLPTPSYANLFNLRHGEPTENYLATTRTIHATIVKPPVLKYHWSLNSVKGGRIMGSPGKDMSVLGSVNVHNGIASFNDGKYSGYIDAGDFQGECVSDPDVCKEGLTISMTNKIYEDSIDSPSRMYLFDSGAGSEDSRGMALWVNRGRIEGAVATRKGTWCLGEDFTPFKNKWVDLVMTWKPNQGLYLFTNCELLAVSGFGTGCDVCTRDSCHQTDSNTHLMFARPNKGPHFKLTHFSSGDISIYEDFFAIDGVKQLCGSNNDFLRKVPMNSLPRYVSHQPIHSPIASSSYVMKKEHTYKKTNERNQPATPTTSKLIANEFEVWPTPSAMDEFHKATERMQTDSSNKASTRQNILTDGGYSQWSDWTPCTGNCGGTSMSVRYCNNPVPKHGGKDCSSIGPARRTRICSSSDCSGSNTLQANVVAKLLPSDLVESDISKRKEISRQDVNQDEDIKNLKEEFELLKQR